MGLIAFLQGLPQLLGVVEAVLIQLVTAAVAVLGAGAVVHLPQELEHLDKDFLAVLEVQLPVAVVGALAPLAQMHHLLA